MGELADLLLVGRVGLDVGVGIIIMVVYIVSLDLVNVPGGCL